VENSPCLNWKQKIIGLCMSNEQYRAIPQITGIADNNLPLVRPGSNIIQ